jgi:hypothetical protein
MADQTNTPSAVTLTDTERLHRAAVNNRSTSHGTKTWGGPDER